jgi:hypothetical protein
VWSLGIVTRLGAGQAGFEFQHGQEIFSFQKLSRQALKAHPASYSVGTTVLSQGSGSEGIKLTIHLHLVPRLRMSGAITLLPLYAIMLWTGITLPFFLSSHNCSYRIYPYTLLGSALTTCSSLNLYTTCYRLILRPICNCKSNISIYPHKNIFPIEL